MDVLLCPSGPRPNGTDSALARRFRAPHADRHGRAAQTPTVIDAGPPSETVSGLSEEGHAGGQFPRPDLVERLTRVLAVTKNAYG
jgi:hypothetical protein